MIVLAFYSYTNSHASESRKIIKSMILAVGINHHLSDNFFISGSICVDKVHQ